MGEIRSYKDLIAWRKAVDLVASVHELTRRFPVDERYGLVAQVRRAAVSVPCNIAEGYGRGTRRDYVHFLDMARGSVNEVETQLVIAERLGLASKDDLTASTKMVDEVQRLLRRLGQSLQSGGRSAPRPSGVRPPPSPLPPPPSTLCPPPSNLRPRS